MNIAVIGLGSIGSVVASQLATTNHSLHLHVRGERGMDVVGSVLVWEAVQEGAEHEGDQAAGADPADGRGQISDTRKTLMATAGICMKSLPLAPGTKSIGANATMLVSTAKVTGPAISRAPAIAAASAGMPCSRFS